MYYTIDDGNGTQITTGVSPHTALRHAQRIADERQETVYMYEDGIEADPEAGYIAVRPTGPLPFRNKDGSVNVVVSADEDGQET